jgi:selenide,water dikinase
MGSVHALTDVTGFGLLGHLLEMCRGAGLGATLDMARVPLLPDVVALAARGYVTGASRRNFESYAEDVIFAASVDSGERAVLTDPQTSGGLLVACAADAQDAVLEVFRREGCADAAVIGRFVDGAPRIVVA